jgi:hypothetical protein
MPSPAASPSAPAARSPVPSVAVLEGAEVVEVDAPVAAALPEPDFKVGRWELQKLPWNALRLTDRKPIPVKTVGPRDAKGVPMRPLGPGGRLVYNPTVIAQQGMKRLDAYRRTKMKVHLRQARKYADTLVRLSDGGKRRRWQPHLYALGVHKKGWVNSNSHGLVLSFISRYYRLTGADKRLNQARRLVRAFEQRPGNERWFSNVTAGRYLWFEHWPDGTKDHTLNAHINAIFGLYDYWAATGDPMAEQYIKGGIKTVRDKLYRFRRKGNLSRYSMASTEGTVHYHETHIEQLRILARITDDEWFRRQAKLFELDGRKWKIKYRGARP